MPTIIVLGFHCSKIVATEKLESLILRKLTEETRQIKDVRGKSVKVSQQKLAVILGYPHRKMKINLFPLKNNHLTMDKYLI